MRAQMYEEALKEIYNEVRTVEDRVIELANVDVEGGVTSPARIQASKDAFVACAESLRKIGQLAEKALARYDS